MRNGKPKDKFIKIRATDEERIQFARIAKRMGLSLSELVRLALRNHREALR